MTWMQKDWTKKFQETCEEMRKNNETTKFLPERGYIIWYQDLECPNCHNKGIFYGNELDYGAFYECASGCYCPSCKTIYDVVEGINFAPFNQKRFLPIMKKKLIELLPTLNLEPKSISEKLTHCLTKNENSCPICGGDTYTFYKDLGRIDYYHNYWTVCVNPDCDWEGEHYEKFESGLY